MISENDIKNIQNMITFNIKLSYSKYSMHANKSCPQYFLIHAKQAVKL